VEKAVFIIVNNITNNMRQYLAENLFRMP